jgi:UDP-glucose 4-epimerase
MRVLITGGAGFIGGHLAARFAGLGARVAVMDNFSTGNMANLGPALETGVRAADIYTEDVCEPADVAGLVRRWEPEVILHLAAQARVLKSTADPFSDARSNILGTISVADAAARSGCRRVIMASSGGAIYGSVPAGDRTAPLRREDAPCSPVSPYGLSKVTANRYLQLYRNLYSLQSVVLNLGNVYGPRLDNEPGTGFVERALAAVSREEPVVIYGDGAQSRDFIFVEDVVDAFVRASLSEKASQYNIGSGQETEINTMIGLLGKILGCPVTVKYGPPNDGEVDRIFLDISRARRDLGWRPRTKLADGLARTAASFSLPSAAAVATAGRANEFRPGISETCERPEPGEALGPGSPGHP